MPKLEGGGHEYAARKWAKGVDIFEKDLLIVPVNVGYASFGLIYLIEGLRYTSLGARIGSQCSFGILTVFSINPSWGK